MPKKKAKATPIEKVEQISKDLKKVK